jgi:hypothetical protein
MGYWSASMLIAQDHSALSPFEITEPHGGGLDRIGADR